MHLLTEQEIASQMKQYLLEQLRAAIPSEEAVLEHLYGHHRMCLSHEDRSEEPHWYLVQSKEQVLKIKRHFCPEAPRTPQESMDILNAVVVGYSIDFSRPTYMTYDLNRHIPIMN